MQCVDPIVVVAVLLLAGITAPSWAQEPTPPPGEDGNPAAPPQAGLLRHRPGHLAKADNLDVLLAQGQISDPLAGNTTLVTWDKIALIWEDETGSKLTTKTYDVNTTLGNPIAKHKNPLSATVDGAGQMDIAAGYLGGTAGWIDTVAAWEHPQGKISMYLEGYNADLDVAVDRLWLDIGEQVQGGYSSGWSVFGAFIRLATGDFDADGYDEFVLAWEGPNKSLNLRVYDTNGGLSPTAEGKISDETLAGRKFLDVATGDFDGDGDAEIAVAWQGQGLSVKVYDVDRDGNLTAEAKLVNEATPGQLALATGDFNGDRVDEIAVGYNTQTQANLYLYQVSDNLHTLTRKGTASQPSGMAISGDELSRALGVGAGDFNADGVDEVAFVYGKPIQPDSGQGYCYVQVYAADASLELTAKGRVLSDWLAAYGNLSLAVGDMNQDVVSEIVVATNDAIDILGDNEVSLGIFQVDPDLNAVRQKGYLEQDEQVSMRGGPFRRLALAVGGFDGKNVRVGPPTYSRLVDTKQLIAVINAPPKHRDEVGGITYDVNVADECPIPPCTYARYETEQKSSTTMGLTTSRDWAVSSEADLKIPHLKTSLEASYGESFEKTTTSFKSQEFGQDVEANHDDAIVRIEQDLDVWEYPVYTDGSDAIQGYILVTWPEKVDPSCSSNCTAAITAVVDGKDPASFYLPNHEYGNALSYSNQPPTDIQTTIKSDTQRYLGVNPYQLWVKWSDVEDTETKKSSKLDLKESLEVSGFGQKLKEQGQYSQGEVSVNKVSFETSTSIHLYFYEIEQKYSYGVRPFFYWAQPDGHLVLDYMVTPATASSGQPPTWWQATYNKPDPAFNLPWKEGELGEDYVLLTKEITLDPPSPTAGETVQVTAKVRNYSLVGVNNVPVRFYAGDPDQGGTQIGQTTIATINPMSSASTQVSFDTSAYSGQTVGIYVVINPNGTIQEMHDDNNKGYALLPVKGLTARVPPATLSLGPDDIILDPQAPESGQTVQIAAMIHATGDTFTHVVVSFWDGEPRRGGRFIGGQLIPMIVAGETGTAETLWDTAGLKGRHEIWVFVAHRSGDDISTDNSARKALNLVPHQLYLPVATR